MKTQHFFLAFSILFLISCNHEKDQKIYSWDQTVDRIWSGPDFWANRLQDWEVNSGKLVCKEASEKKPMRTVHLVSTRLQHSGAFEMSVQTGLNQEYSEVNETTSSGFLIGAGASIDYRAAALIHHSPGNNGGYYIGVQSSGQLFILDFNTKEQNILASSKIEKLPSNYRIHVQGMQKEGGYTLLAQVLDAQHNTLSSLEYQIDENLVNGNVALVSHPGKGENTGAYWFNHWALSGEKFSPNEEHISGPIISAQYTLSNAILKLNAQMMPLGNTDGQEVTLEFKRNTSWEVAAKANIQEFSYNALFRVENYHESTNIPYRISYKLKDNGKIYYYEGSIKADPVDEDQVVVAGFTGNHNLAKGVERGPFNWKRDIWYPHTELVNNVEKHHPDLLFFSGDQIYEGASPSTPDRQNIMIDYMYKWYLWCWAYADITKNIPSITIPDDHDVFQGNVWGNGGGNTDIDTKGGYVYGAKFVKMVERTQVSHLPDPFDPTPIRTGIGTYYTSMNIGRISFAIIEDRKFKSGPLGLVPPTKSGRPDHVIDPNYTYEMADVPGATLLGDRQLLFLKNWTSDWKASDMKVVLSQTIFGNMATHHGGNLMHLYMDFDSNGWPQTGRNKALKQIRKGFGFMLGGDQHLATIVHHGVDEFNDSGWSFCVPSIANFYPRAWMPFEEYGKNYIEGLQKYTGEYLDGLGNKVNVYAHTNPGQDYGIEPKNLHNRMPGYGIVKFTKSTREITMECWPRYVDPSNPETGSQYPGWPRTIQMQDNYAKPAYKWLRPLKMTNQKNAVVQVIHEQSKEIVYTLRINGDLFVPKVFEDGTYTVIVSEPDEEKEKVVTGLTVQNNKEGATLEIVL